ncbi:hypothetical protein AK88_01185 [Plasmodium fragile]|uniref:Plasmodium RESA N-terminal domain-containing protein n=1 Tax=Plasmodium fragile TaxID=5857 RepID=A0A0D9QPX9_PLAFR|nr:uncharacterized protein AK88_01185 [Plasmodium fragile]KJP89099.1 hypothetical protein AK88_01185 [Plasmodium fragile]
MYIRTTKLKGCGHFLRPFRSLLILLLCIFSNGGIRVDQESCREGRTVVHINGDPFCKNFHFGRFLSEDVVETESPPTNVKEAFEGYPPEAPYEITKEELRTRLAYCGRLFVCKKRAHAAIYVYINYLRAQYYDMIRGLKKTFDELAYENEIPEEVKNKYWKECEAERLSGLLAMEHVAQKYFEGIMNNKVILTPQFNWSLSAHESFWLSEMFEKELKWKKIFFDLANNYAVEDEAKY